MQSRTRGCFDGISFAINPAVNVKIVVMQHHLALGTREAPSVVLLLALGLEELALDAHVACGAERAVDLMVMSFTVRLISVNVEGCSLERRETGCADKA